MTLTTHLNLVPRLRMSGAVRPLPVYTATTRTGKILPSQQHGLSTLIQTGASKEKP